MAIAGAILILAGAVLYGAGAIARSTNPEPDGHEQFFAWPCFIVGFLLVAWEVLVYANALFR